MKEIQKLLDYRPEIRVLDATLRDGGLVNNFMFTDEFVQDLYKTNIKAGVDYMEFGYKADPDMFKESEFGKWKFSKDEDIRAIVGENDTDLKISIMADVGRCNYKRDILPRSESPIDMIRVACYIHQIPAAIEMIEDAHKKEYETTCNIMAISTSGENDWRAALDLVCKSSVDVIYIVDSYGSLYPEQIQRICALYKEYADKYKKEIGMHAHNNQQLAFANTIEACGDGVNFLDATYGMMGRGAGNCAIELLLGFLKNPKYNIYPALQFIENQIVPLKKQGVMWGYDIPYLLTGLLNQHPRDAIAFAGKKKTDYTEFWNTLTGKD
ncbi:MAG: nucleoid-structuring protein H-NS [Treponema sp.]|nr:nucleoid-structuring protein H-NS [Treponema sp.]